MTAFFIRTDSCATGPFTGVELREAALAGIIGPDSAISRSPQGPWYLASSAGLFSEKRIALPHPADVQVPTYQVRGMSGAFQGPFKLRELIGFAVRGMLPGTALLQSGPSQPWIPVHRIRVLSACLEGELALLDSQGNVIKRAMQRPAAIVDVSRARAPIELAQTVSHDDSTSFAKPSDDSGRPASQPTPKDSALKGEFAGSSTPIDGGGEANRTSRALRPLLRSLWRELRTRNLWEQPILSRRTVATIFILSGLAAAIPMVSRWQGRPMQREQVIGEWVVVAAGKNDHTESSFGISFRKNGNCVIFNPSRDSWSGDYAWVDREDESVGFSNLDPMTVKIDQAEPHHPIDTIRPTDGYIRFVGVQDDFPILDGHPVRDLFVRYEANALRLGYLISITWDHHHKTMEAAWLTVSKTDSASASDHPSTNTLAGGSVDTLNASEFLSVYGIPDEARRIYPFEVPQDRRSNDFIGAQIVRYGLDRWILMSNGKALAMLETKRN